MQILVCFFSSNSLKKLIADDLHDVYNDESNLSLTLTDLLQQFQIYPTRKMLCNVSCLTLS